MSSLIRLLQGTVTLRICGAELERFLNLCAECQIRFWNHTKHTFDEMGLTIAARDFFRLPPIVRKTRCRVHLCSRHGLPFLLRKVRPVLAIGVILFVLIAWVMSGFLWSIEITGADAASHDLIRSALAENGVKPGAYTKRLDLERVRNQILIDLPEFIYLNINLHGSHADVAVKKRIRPPEIVRENGFANIVAKEGGVIERITVYEGTPEVSPGDLVVPGQLLANGYMTGRSGVSVPTHARADVYARTWQTKRILFPLEAEQITLTGDTYRKYTLVFGKKRIKILQKGSIPEHECDRIIKKTQLSLPGGLTLPLYLELETAQVCRLDRALLPLPYAITFGTQALEDSLVLSDTDRLLDLRFSATEQNGTVELEMIAECVKQIGVEQ
ncbi:MAG: sporulation protein YqfD [Oscillospiraceae bacterium]|nr:sporulation protein YqfD [Oscillospiraceae bacterium]